MKNYLAILITLTLNIYANKADYDRLFDNINHGDDNITKETIKRYVYSSYNIKAHRTNYFLPLSHRMSNSYNDNSGLEHDSSTTEAEFQISIKFEIGANLFGLGEVYSAAYTQKSFWQIYVPSAFFRETNYNPEIFTKIPITIDYKENGIKAIQLGFAHMSNGRGGIKERSWNYFYTDLYFQIKPMFLDLKFWNRVEDTQDYNPELLDYLGHGQVRFILPYKKSIFEMKFRYGQKSKLTSQFNFSYPVFLRDDLFFYLKVFNGYGESLIDYNQKIKKIGFGFSISR